MSDALLSPITPAFKADLGRKPHRRYRLIREKFEEIVRARDELKLSDRQAARSLGLRGAKEFAEAYELLKRNGEAIVMRGDWTGVEHALYTRFPHYQRDPLFHKLLDEFKDPRPREMAAPVLPVPTAEAKPPAGEGAPPAVTIPSPAQSSLDAPAVPVEPVAPTKRWGRSARPSPESADQA